MVEYWKSRLSISSQRQYEMLLEQIKRKKSIVQSPARPDVRELEKIYQYITYDHPELYYISPQLSVQMSLWSQTINLSYLYDNKQSQEIDNSFRKIQYELKRESNKSDKEKILAAAFLLVKNSRYEINNFYNQNAASVIHYHAAQCSGFASAFKYAMDTLGIWCITVGGNVINAMQSGPHAWNIIKLNGSYCHIDITSLSQEQLTDVNQLSRYKLFDSDDQKKQMGYTWKYEETPKCPETEITSPGKTPVNVGGSKLVSCKNTNADNNNLPTFTRLFDIQVKIKECLQKRTPYYEFLLNIPVYSNEKLMKLVTNEVSKSAKELSVACQVEVGFVNGKFYLKFNYKN